MNKGDLSSLSEEQIRQELMRRQSVSYSEAEVQVTILMPCLNAWRWLARSLYHIEKGSQSLPMYFHTADQQSTDKMTPHILKNLGDEAVKQGFRKYRFLGDVKNHGELMRNMCTIRQVLGDSVETAFGLFVDADVCLPAGAAHTMLEVMQAESKLGILGIQYEPILTHVQAGCTMIRKELLTQFKWRVDGCECNWMCKEAVELGYEVRHLEGWWARHLKHEQGG